MNPKNRKALAHRVRMASEAALAARKYVTSIDVLVGIGWLDAGAVKRWRQGQVGYLERVVQANLSRISEAMKLFRSWSAERGLSPSETKYVAHTPRRPALRFSKSGNPGIEKLYRTHWVSPELSKMASRTPARDRDAATGSGESRRQPASLRPDAGGLDDFGPFLEVAGDEFSEFG